MRHEDQVRLRDMLAQAELIAQFVAGRAREDLDHDLVLLYALVRAVEVFGEAASRLSPDTRARANGIPWRNIIAMRNRLVHAYSDIDRDTVWAAATREVPSLVPLLEALASTDKR